MALIFFIGRPGSGKSTARRYIARHLQSANRRVMELCDYEILREWAEHDPWGRLRVTEQGGFEVIDHQCFAEAIAEIERLVRLAGWPDVDADFLVEFARDEYHRSLEAFSPELLADAHTFFTDADLELCIQRVEQRVLDGHRTSHPVPVSIMLSYYSRDVWPQMARLAEAGAARPDGGEGRRRRIIAAVKNEGSVLSLCAAADVFIGQITRSEEDTSDGQPRNADTSLTDRGQNSSADGDPEPPPFAVGEAASPVVCLRA